MPAVEDLCSEPNFTAHWMSDTSRAGVLLDPNFPGLKINRTSLFSGHENIMADVDEVPHFSNSCSISEDSLCEEQILESSSLSRAQQHSTETSFPAAAYSLEASKRMFVHGEEDGRNKLHYNHPLLQKLEQLKELQQQKQEQLKKQQMEQLQRLMEEKQKLLNMVSAQTAVRGSALVAEGQNPRSEHSLGLTALQFPSSLYQNHSEVRAFALNNVSSQTQDSRFLQKINNKECISSLMSSLPAVSACEKHCLGAPLKVQNCLESNEEDKYTTGKSMCPEHKMEESVENKDCNMDHTCVRNADSSEKSDGENQLRVTSTEERPIKAGIQEKKRTFEEFLEEQIQLEEQRLKQKQELQERSRSTIQKPVIKRPFLKRGEGLTRFTSAKSKVTKLRENTPKPQQSVAEDRSQMQKKTVLFSEPVSESSFAPSTKYNQSGKVKQGPIQKTLVLRNHSGKNTIPLEARVQTQKNLDGQMKDSFPSEIYNETENKENIMDFGKSVNMDNGIRNKFPDVEKPHLCREPTSASSNPKCFKSHSLRGPEQSFDVSFQNKLENWEKEKEKENLELDEFLFLEQAADEISFSSNSSFVQRILDQDQQTLKGRRMSSTPIKAKQQQADALAVKLKNKRNNKSNSDTQGNKNDRTVLHTVSTSGKALRLKDQFNKTDSMFSASSMMVVPALKNTQWIVTEDKDERNSNISTDSETESETTLKCESEDANTSFTSHRESDPELSGYGGSVTNINRERKSGDGDLDLPDKDCNTLSKQSRASDCQRSMSHLNRSRFEFDDERTWSDLDENFVQNDLPEKCTIKMPLQAEFSCKNGTFVPDKTIKRKVASKRGDEPYEEPAVDDDSNGPPASNLMMKLFPSLKAKQKTGCPSEHEIKSSQEQEPVGNTAPSQLLKEKLTELETEIERFRAENTTLTKLREERERALASLRKEIADFQQQKAQELAEIEEYKKKEMKKLQKERKVFEKYTTEVRAIPDKKERDEIQALKQQITELQEDIKRKETKWLTTQRRLRDQIEVLVNENLELKEEVKIMEKFRVEAWKKAEAAGNKRKIENLGMKRAESVCLPNRGQKSQAPAPLLPAQNCSKISGKGHLQAKGRLAKTPKSAPAYDRNHMDETVMALDPLEEASMEDASPNEPLVSVPSVPAYTGTEEIQREIAYPDGKVEKVLKNGCHLIFFPNGTWKKVSSDAKTVTITFFNGDVKQVMPDQTVIYYYADAKTTHTTYPDGLEVLQFPNGQIEKHYPDGRKEITFPDQTIKNLFLDGQEESIFPDGTIVRVQRDGSKTIEFNNGQRELHTAQFKRREYPDGTVKTVYMNGQQETKYISGRVRIKDKDGNIIMDTKV